MPLTGYAFIISFISMLLSVAAPAIAEKWPPLSPGDLAKIKAAVPEKALVKPLKPRKLLVFSLGPEANHKATPHGKVALKLIGQRTGAFEVTHTSDPSMLKAAALAPFDALLLNNSNRMSCLNDPEIQDAILKFIRAGKGFVGIHAATTNFVPKFKSNWPEGAEMIGGVFDGHPWHEKVTIKVEEPDHPINAAFEDNTFEIEDEIYQFTGPYSREKVRVLLSLDKTKSDMSAEKRAKIKRDDLDFPVSWVR
ncbi:MAG: ThuA domain-containing protein, partial [Planctomycetes bacterium]|nr:ThuA domain-containing protein [Planctomycetota bacterium]